MLRRRREWYDEFLRGGFSLRGLRRFAPMIARAVEQRLTRLDPAAFGEHRAVYERFLGSELTLAGLRQAAPAVGCSIDAELTRPA